jgi:hypothetical protein
VCVCVLLFSPPSSSVWSRVYAAPPRGNIYIYICSFEHQKSDNKERIARSSLSSGENTAQTTKRTHTLAARKEKTHTEKKKNELRARTLGHFCVVFFALV